METTHLKFLKFVEGYLSDLDFEIFLLSKYNTKFLIFKKTGSPSISKQIFFPIYFIKTGLPRFLNPSLRAWIKMEIQLILWISVLFPIQLNFLFLVH
eukprot:07179_3